MTNIEEFLAARYAEEEAEAEADANNQDAENYTHSFDEWRGVYAIKDRTLADIAMKRRLLNRAWTAVQYRLAVGPGFADAEAAAYDAFWILDELASVYSGHPDYNPAWKSQAS